MRVTQSGSNPVHNASTHETRHTGKASAAHDANKKKASTEVAGHGDTSGTHASISDRGRELASAKAVASGAPDVREEKIAELRKRIAEGKYNVDPHAVADRMVDDHIKMSGIG